ncbi:metallophosphoesterase family protein [Mongoliimonas terrestris]|uniref:metallophosphoesterase family protein n=1 Tax=Mongoliimonas terrestris TaxID=1709001 RepID=UPI0009499C24|nr:metallophosphoesterase [Mongoliimonas terrestris]
MSTFTLVQLSDIHLSRSRPFFQFNYDIALEAVADIEPDVIVVTGDLALNGPDDADDIAFAASQLERLPAAWHAVPGNHDVGLVPFDGGLHQAIDDTRLAAYKAVFEEDRFVTKVGGWTFVGLNSQLLGSGLDAEGEQEDWLAATLAAADGPIGLFLHYPLFLESPDEAVDSHSVVRPAPRRRLLDRLAGDKRVRLVGSGHLHQEKRMDVGGIQYQWAPSTAFITTESDHGGEAYAGFLVYRFDGETVSVERVEPRWMINHDIRNWGRSEPHGYYEIVKRPFPAIL